MSMSQKTILLKATVVVLAPILAILIGCGDESDLASVRGTVKVDGEPLVSGSIRFTPVEDNPGPAGGGTIENGKYRCDKVAIGQNNVLIIGSMKIGEPNPNPPELGGQPGPDLPEEVIILRGKKPLEYEEEGELTADIEYGNNSQNFNLTAKTSE